MGVFTPEAFAATFLRHKAHNMALDLGAWSVGSSSLTVTSGVADPDGGTAARRYTEAATTSAHSVSANYGVSLLGDIPSYGLYTFSISAKADGRNIVFSNNVAPFNVRVYFDLANGVILSVTGSNNGGGFNAIIDEGTGWWRLHSGFNITGRSGLVPAGINLADVDGGFSYTGDVSKSVILYRPLVVKGLQIARRPLSGQPNFYLPRP
jgi:hypothetical protein